MLPDSKYSRACFLLYGIRICGHETVTLPSPIKLKNANPDACEQGFVHSLLVYLANLAVYIEHGAKQFL